MKKFCILLFVLFAFLSISDPEIVYAETDLNSYVVVANSAIVYQNANFSSQKIKTLQQKTEIKLELENSSPKKYQNDDFVFFKIVDDGFILSSLVAKKTDTINATPVFNGKTNTECFVFSMQNEKLEGTNIILFKNQEIFMYEGYNSKSEYTAISFVYDNEVMYGYIKTENIAPNGINPVIISVFSLVVAILGVILSWIFIKGKKTKI